MCAPPPTNVRAAADQRVRFVRTTTGQPVPAATGVDGKIYLALMPVKKRWEIYKNEQTHDGELSKKRSGHYEYPMFLVVWKCEVAKPWVDLEGNLFDVEERCERVRGFKRCDRCEAILEQIRKAKSRLARDSWREKQKEHWHHVHEGMLCFHPTK